MKPGLSRQPIVVRGRPHVPPRVRRVLGLGLGLTAGLLGLLASPHTATAQQIDVAPPLPNVMLLLDTSGSMEKMIDGTAAVCNALPAASLPNRWGQAVQSLTGGISPQYSCVQMPRTANSAFDEEYTINGQAPYDIGYYVPFSRPVALTSSNEACVVAPLGLPGVNTPQGVGKTTPKGVGGSVYDFDGTINSRILGVSAGVPTGITSATCQFTQLNNGALDGARDLIRFGLMTFDTDVLPGTGILPGSPPSVVAGNLFTGMWSYFPNWNATGGTSNAQGRPYNCLTDQLFEVGARNSAAPPWEGRLIGIPTNSNATIDDIRQHNDRIQLAISAMRPYGATPIAGMLTDAKYYFWDDPTGPQKNDVYVQGGCRDEYIILVTDGAPNLDARPQCNPEGPTPPDGKCPFKLPDEIADQLAKGTDGTLSGKRVNTYVIGFAVSKIEDDTPIECQDLSADPVRFANVCSDPTKAALYGACCTLEKIAIAGGTNKAYFVKNQQDLSAALADIIGRIGRRSTTRTTPAYSPQVAEVANDPTQPITNSSVFTSAFTPSPGEAWRGTVQRTRYVCGSDFQLQTPAIDSSKGDDFAQNLNNGSGGKYSERRFSVIEPAALADGTTNPTGTIRPFVSTSQDNLPLYSATATVPVSATDAIAALTDKSLKIQATVDCPNLLNNARLPAADCKRVALDYAFGSQSSVTMPAGFAPFVSREKNAFGDIFHATPTVVGPPNALIRDETYGKFRALYKDRPTVLYAATNDGLLHAFDTSVASLERNELWAMVIPGVLPKLKGVYPNGHTLMLDGPPVVKDTVWDRKAIELADVSKWHTTLVAGFGQAGRGYFAVDVTDPRRPDGDPAGAGPSFRWQLTDMPVEMPGNIQKQIFGQRSAIPAITTVFVDLGGSEGTKEIGVAILPGGIENAPYGSSPCNRANTDRTKDSAPPVDQGFAPRTQVRCWGAPGAVVPGRSLSLVRLDNGTILRTFIRQADAPKALVDTNRVSDTPLDSPMTGVPIVYPPQVGAVAQKIFIGDADGTVWRFDLTSKDPTQWKGELFFDTVTTKLGTPDPLAWNKGQPIVVPPTVALDRFGQLVVAMASGDQDVFTATGTNYLYSVSEKLASDTKLRAFPNWFLQFESGERVSGPMAIYDGILYFATFAAAESTAICSGGQPKVWGRDFVTPEDPAALEKGGVKRFNPAAQTPPPDYFDPGYQGKIIPGVSINVTPTCADTSTSVQDPYVPGATHYKVSTVNAGSPSLLAQVGGQDAQGRPLVFQQGLPTPRTPTSVDSWASVVE